MLRFTYFVLISFLIFLSCSSRGPAIIEEPILDIEPAPFLHIIKSRNETLSKIADWYTGSPNNWKRIASYNDKGDSSIVRLGESIFIPHELLIREDILKLGDDRINKEFIKPPSRKKRDLKPVAELQGEEINKNAPKEAEVSDVSKAKEEIDLDEISRLAEPLPSEPLGDSLKYDNNDFEPFGESSDLIIEQKKEHDTQETLSKDNKQEDKELKELEQAKNPNEAKNEPSKVSLELDEDERKRVRLLEELLKK